MKKAFAYIVGITFFSLLMFGTVVAATYEGNDLLGSDAFPEARVENIEQFLAVIVKILVGYIVPIIVSLAVIVFIWGVLQYVTSGGDEGKRTESVKYMFWGIVGLTVMVSVWGLVNLLRGSFFPGQESILPGLPPTR